MRASARGIELIKSFEQCRLIAYKPTPDDVFTCGWGSTQGVTADTTWTQAQADLAFAADLERFEQCVSDALEVEVTQNQFDAMVSLAYNIGCNAFRNSTLLRLVNAGNAEAARQQFGRWNKQKGKVLSGLTRRRDHEAALFALA